MINELGDHGYSVSPGTMYPVLHDLEGAGALKSNKVNVNGKLRRYYSTTKKGNKILNEARGKIRELVGEVMD